MEERTKQNLQLAWFATSLITGIILIPVAATIISGSEDFEGSLRAWGIMPKKPDEKTEADKRLGKF